MENVWPEESVVIDTLTHLDVGETITVRSSILGTLFLEQEGVFTGTRSQVDVFENIKWARETLQEKDGLVCEVIDYIDDNKVVLCPLETEEKNESVFYLGSWR